MFFASEFLQKRDSGLGLLWLAATIGSKASFKKINRRSILSANVIQLCDMIAEPEEPLALRLSSNLLVGVVRVHRAQHEMLYTDVMSCFTLLKKAGLDLSSDNQMQGPAALRKDQITFSDVPFLLDFDMLEPIWNDLPLLDVTPLPSQVGEPEQHSDQEGLSEGRSNDNTTPGRRRRLHLLDEVLNDDRSFDLSGPSDDPFLEPDFHSMGEEVDLGLDFGLIDERGFQDDIPPHDGPVEDADIQFGLNDNDNIGLNLDAVLHNDQDPDIMDNINYQMNSPQVSPPPRQPTSPTAPNEIVGEIAESHLGSSPLPKSLAKRTNNARRPKQQQHPLVDSAIELTDQQLQTMKDGYDERMRAENLLLKRKRVEEITAKRLQTLLMAAPLGIEDPGMMKWASDIMKLQRDAHSRKGRKRRRLDDDFLKPNLPAKAPRMERLEWPDPAQDEGQDEFGQPQWSIQEAFNLEPDVPMELDAQAEGSVRGGSNPLPQTPEEGRRGSSQPSSRVGSQINGRNSKISLDSRHIWNEPEPNDLGDESFGASSSDAGRKFGGLDLQGFPNTPLRTPSVRDDYGAIVLGGRDSGGPGSVDLALVAEDRDSLLDDTQRTDASLFTLQQTMEKESFQFLRHVSKMAEAQGTQRLSFRNYLKTEKTSRRTAAAGFYHLLELATKRHLSIRQDTPYGDIVFTIPIHEQSLEGAWS